MVKITNFTMMIMTPRLPYDTDISEQQWQLLKPHLPEAKTGGKKTDDQSTRSG